MSIVVSTVIAFVLLIGIIKLSIRPRHFPPGKTNQNLIIDSCFIEFILILEWINVDRTERMAVDWKCFTALAKRTNLFDATETRKNVRISDGILLGTDSAIHFRYRSRRRQRDSTQRIFEQ